MKKLIIALVVTFVIESSLTSPTYVMMQTPFMQKALEDGLLLWGENNHNSEEPSASRHGFVTDGDHSFFTSGVLLVSVVFHPVTLAWVPVLYTWIQRQDIPHHRPHFRCISRSVMDLLEKHKIPFHSKYLTHVMDLFHP